MKVITGFQTGADLGAILAASKAGFPTGGYTVKGYKTEKGCWPDLKNYGAIDNCVSYKQRTEKNVYIADLVLIIVHKWDSPGTVLTLSCARKYKKPVRRVLLEDIWPATMTDEKRLICLDREEEILSGLFKHNPSALMVAGNRESIAPGIQLATEIFLYRIFATYKKHMGVVNE